jgi:aspartate/methionine/tyrosine aminotransferase
MMVPLPVQMAMIAALSDDVHVAEQRARYNARRAALTPALRAAGFSIDHSEAGLYIGLLDKKIVGIQWLGWLTSNT